MLTGTLAPLKQPTVVQRENDLQLLVYEALKLLVNEALS